jgi:hypothetical protein
LSLTRALFLAMLTLLAACGFPIARLLLFALREHLPGDARVFRGRRRSAARHSFLRDDASGTGRAKTRRPLSSQAPNIATASSSRFPAPAGSANCACATCTPYRVVDAKGRDLMAPGSVELVRDLTYDDSNVLAKQQEEVLLWRDMEERPGASVDAPPGGRQTGSKRVEAGAPAQPGDAAALSKPVDANAVDAVDAPNGATPAKPALAR